MRIAVIGAGALGLLYGGMLSKEHEVVLFEASNDAVDKINSYGVDVSYEENTNHYNTKASISGNGQGVFDLIFVSVKTIYTESALKQNSNIIGPNTYVMTIQNGLGNKENLMKFVDEKHIILGITRTNSIKESTVAARRVNLGLTEIGYSEDNKDFVLALVESFNNCGFETVSTPTIDYEIYSKLLLNITTNPLCANYDITLGECYSLKYYSLIKNILAEAIEVAKAIGLDFDLDEVFKNNKNLCMNAASGRPSMWQDVKAKRKTEIDYLNGAVSRLGKLYNIDTRVNDSIVEKIHYIEEKY